MAWEALRMHPYQLRFSNQRRFPFKEECKAMSSLLERSNNAGCLYSSRVFNERTIPERDFLTLTVGRPEEIVDFLMFTSSLARTSFNAVHNLPPKLTTYHQYHPAHAHPTSTSAHSPRTTTSHFAISNKLTPNPSSSISSPCAAK